MSHAPRYRYISRKAVYITALVRAGASPITGSDWSSGMRYLVSPLSAYSSTSTAYRRPSKKPLPSNGLSHDDQNTSGVSTPTHGAPMPPKPPMRKHE